MGNNKANNAAQLNSARTRVGNYFTEVPQCTDESCDDGNPCTRDECDFFCTHTYDDTLCPSSEPSTSSEPSSTPSDQPSVVTTAPSSKPTTSAAPSFSSAEPSQGPSDQPSDQPSFTPVWTEIFAQGFESGLDNFNDAGSDVRLYSGTKYSYSGSKSLQLRDDTATSLSVTKPFRVSGYSTLKVEFWYKSQRFRHGSDAFFLQSADGDDGTEWITKGSWTYKSNGFNSNNKWRSATVKFQIETGTMRIRFKNNGHNNKERIYIDDVKVSGGADPSAMPSSLPSLSTAPSSKPTTSAAPSFSSAEPSQGPSVEPSENPSTSTKPSDQPSGQPSFSTIWTVIFDNDFQSGLGNFIDAGKNMRGKSGALELRGKSATSLGFTNSFPVESCLTLKVEFRYKSSRFRHRSDAFFLQSADGDDGTEWITKGSWTYKSNGFNSNNKWRSASVKFQIETDTMRIRFKNNGHNRRERIYIDDVKVSCGADPSAT
jgi:hypothetical protein